MKYLLLLFLVCCTTVNEVREINKTAKDFAERNGFHDVVCYDYSLVDTYGMCAALSIDDFEVKFVCYTTSCTSY